MQPKASQQLLGHAGINTIMDRCVHVTDELLVNAVRQFEAAASTVYEKERKKGVEIIYRKAENLENKGFLNR